MILMSLANECPIFAQNTFAPDHFSKQTVRHLSVMPTSRDGRQVVMPFMTRLRREPSSTLPLWLKFREPSLTLVRPLVATEHVVSNHKATFVDPNFTDMTIAIPVAVDFDSCAHIG